MLRNPRYRGVYIHGRINRVRRGGKRLTHAAPAQDVISVDVPEWRIIDDTTWFAVQDLMEDRSVERAPLSGPCTRYALSALARCTCGGPIGATIQRGKKAYACTRHHQRGNAVCEVKLRQPIDEVEAAVAQKVLEKWLTPDVIAEIVTALREHLTAQFDATAHDAAVLDQELTRLRAEQRNLASAIATGGDAIPELVTELRRRNDRSRLLEIDIASDRRTPAMVEDMIRRAEQAAVRRMGELRAMLAAPGDGREVYEALFPERGWFSSQPGAATGGGRYGRSQRPPTPHVPY
jgi:hypothetical protein